MDETDLRIIMLLIIISILLLVGSFYKEGDTGFLELVQRYKVGILITVAVGVILAFVVALGWYDEIVSWCKKYTTALWSIVFGVFMLILIGFIVKSPDEKPKEEKKKEESK